MSNDKNTVCLEISDFSKLLALLKSQGYLLVGPTKTNNAIVYEEIENIKSLPIGWTEEQDAGTYALKKREDQALFGYNVGPHSWKQFLFPSREPILKLTKTKDGFEVLADDYTTPQYAFIGVRSCDLHAIQIQDRVFIGDTHKNPRYQGRRENAFIVAINCGQAANTCFCSSMKTGPKVDAGFDIALTEIINDKDHYFVAEAGSERGKEILKTTPHRDATNTDLTKADECTARAESEMGRSLDTTDIKNLFYKNYNNPIWEDVAKRCLSCANCTLACPTCFCSKIEDTTDLTGEHAERWLSWDSCFSADFSYIHDTTIRSSTKSRYRQWITHKLASWIDQFDTSGCVGCGRCITWCPVGIDITAEVKKLRHNDGNDDSNDDGVKGVNNGQN